MLRNNSKQSGEYFNRRKEGLQWEGFVEKESFKPVMKRVSG